MKVLQLSYNAQWCMGQKSGCTGRKKEKNARENVISPPRCTPLVNNSQLFSHPLNQGYTPGFRLLAWWYAVGKIKVVRLVVGLRHCLVCWLGSRARLYQLLVDHLQRISRKQDKEGIERNTIPDHRPGDGVNAGMDHNQEINRR